MPPAPPPSALAHWLLLALAGAAGTLARAAVTEVAVRIAGPSFPWGTTLVNVLGALAFGAIVAAGRSRAAFAPGLDGVLLVGLLGGFTTFSSYAFQAVDLWQSGRHAAAAAYVIGSNALALLAVWAGLRMAA